MKPVSTISALSIDIDRVDVPTRFGIRLKEGEVVLLG